jgi:hypothetical protein
MTAENLKHVAELSAAFQGAVTARFGASYVRVADNTLNDAVRANPEYMLRRTGVADEDIASKVILAELTAVSAVRCKSAKKVAALVPDELKSEENVALLRSMGADRLVELCTRPAPRQRKFGVF